MRAEAPAALLELLSVPGLRPDKVLKLHRELGISNLAELEAAARADRLAGVKGLGPSLQRKILRGLEMQKTARGARHMHRAAGLIEAAKKNLERSGYERIVTAGDLRRGTELIADLALVAEATHLPDGPTAMKTGDLTVHVTDARRFGITLLLATGSAAHLDELRGCAHEKGMELTTNGLMRGSKIVAAKTETEIYAALGLSYIEPELREGRGEVTLAKRRRLPSLVREDDIHGVLHAHTDASDGMATLAQMTEAARERGFQYIGITDHSQSAHYAGGLSLAEIEAQHDEIDRLNARFDGDFRIFKGIESDIRADGALDYDEDTLRLFDFIIISVHDQFRMDEKAQTERILRAVSNPHATILGHMTGRQLLRRPGYEVDIETILAACAKHGVAVEVNANPWRLDVDWRWHRLGLELGCKFSVNPDAHSTAEIDNLRWGVAMARKGGVGADRVVNALDLRGFSRWLRERSRRRSGGIRRDSSRVPLRG
jgi:DNA polymerase (family 10)